MLTKNLVSILRVSWRANWRLSWNHQRSCEAKLTTLKRPSPGEGLRVTCLMLTTIGTWNVTSTLLIVNIAYDDDASLMITSWMSRVFTNSSSQVMALATHAFKYIPLEVLGLAKLFSPVPLALVRPLLVESMKQRSTPQLEDHPALNAYYMLKAAVWLSS